MMRIILGIIAFLVTFVLSSTLVGILFGFPKSSANTTVYRLNHDGAVAKRIERLLKQDVRNGRARHIIGARVYQSGDFEGSLYSNEQYRNTVLAYVRASSSMSDRGLPKDFQYAWRKHMQAWQKQAAHVRSFGQEGVNYRVGADNTREINDSWDQVLRIGARYGLKVDRSYYR